MSGSGDGASGGTGRCGFSCGGDIATRGGSCSNGTLSGTRCSGFSDFSNRNGVSTLCFSCGTHDREGHCLRNGGNFVSWNLCDDSGDDTRNFGSVGNINTGGREDSGDISGGRSTGDQSTNFGFLRGGECCLRECGPAYEEANEERSEDFAKYFHDVCRRVCKKYLDEES